MAYRPHFAFRTPSGMVDELAEFPFDYRQAPGFGVTVLALPNQILRIDADADFLWRALYWDGGCFANLLTGQVGYRIRDPFGNYLSSDYIPAMILGQGAYTVQPWVSQVTSSVVANGPLYNSPFSGGMAVPLVDEIFCPRGSTLALDLIWIGTPPTSSSASYLNRLLARGVKRRPISDCATEYR
jgi:hypothetical protein